ncbi:MAG TPA: ABC transporter permease [Chthoniobacterales bacterium]|jgi:ABC-type spermidine/putrescine transport system permease subunit I
MKTSWKPWLWAAPTLVLLFGLVAWPLLLLVRLSLCRGGGGQSGVGIGGSFYQPGTWTLDVYRSLAADHYFWEVLGFTVWLGVVVASLCVLLGYPTAHFIWRLPAAWKKVALATVIVPKLSSLLVTIYGLKLILGDHGPVNDFLHWSWLTESPVALQNSALGVVIGKTILILPYTILLIWAGLERVDRQLLAAARGLGAGAWATFLHVTLPLSLPALSTASLVSLIWGLGAFISPYLLGRPQEITLAVDVQRQMFENLHWPRGAAEGVVMLATLALLAGIYGMAQGWFLKKSGAAGELT